MQLNASVRLEKFNLMEGHIRILVYLREVAKYVASIVRDTYLWKERKWLNI